MTNEEQLTLPVLEVLSESLLGELTTTELRLEIKRRIQLDVSDHKPIRNRPDTRIDQIIRNVKCHRSSEKNPFAIGYLEEVPRGFRITDKGREFLKGIA